MKYGNKMRLSALLPGAVAAAIAIGGPAALALAGSAPQAGSPVLVVAPPWRDAAAVVRQAGGALAFPLDAPMAALGVFAGLVPLEDLSAAGAWAVLDGRVLAALCGASS